MSINTCIKVGLHLDRCIRLAPHLQILPWNLQNICPITHRTLSLSHTHRVITKESLKDTGEGFFKRNWKSLKFHVFQKYKLKARSYLLYEKIIDAVPHEVFFKEMGLPDTMNSWFLLTELHVWMLMVRAMEIEKEGRIIRNNLVEAMWGDVLEKAKRLDEGSSSLAKKQIPILADQFQAAIIGYDEGLLKDDKVLASALWRRFFNRNTDVENLEALVKYVRQQMHYLDNLSEDDFLMLKIKLPPLDRRKP